MSKGLQENRRCYVREQLIYYKLPWSNITLSEQ